MPHASSRPEFTPAAPLPPSTPAAPPPRHFLQQIIDDDCAAGRWGLWSAADAGALPRRAGKPRVHTRFPPEPNGYLHVGHAKSICLNFGLAREFDGKFNLRFDDTNPCKEEQEYVDSIIADILWLGADFNGPHGGGLHFASDYFEAMYGFAEDLIRKGLAYVCDLSPEQVAEFRGPPSRPGRPSPFRDRPPVESLDLLRRMRAGEFPAGARTLRARIDLPAPHDAPMSSPNINLRDPVLYRILHEDHQHVGAAWRIYPMYDWAHGFEDSIEGITHSICTLEFENHRPLYNWFIDAVNRGRSPGSTPPPIHHPRQIEFSRLNLTYTVMSKRKLLELVEKCAVAGWDDPRMPTISGLRRRGYTREALWAFADDVGCTRQESIIDVGRLENACRDHLNKAAPRAMCVLHPLKVVIDNWPRTPDGSPVVELLDFVINPEDPAAGVRKIPFAGELWIERDDFLSEPNKKFFRLIPPGPDGSPAQEVRLRWAYFIRCTGFERDDAGRVTLVRCTYDPATRGGDAPVGPDGKPSRKVKGTIHWVSALHALDGEVRLFDRLFAHPEPGARTGAFLDDLNPASLEVITDAKLDPSLADAARYRRAVLGPGYHGAPSTAGEGDRFQFERLGYFCVDPDSGARFGGTGAAGDVLVFNRTVTLKDTWAKEAAKGD